jgi:hypothetical protein
MGHNLSMTGKRGEEAVVVAWLCDLVTWMAFDFLISQDIVVFLQCFTQLLTFLLYLIQLKE